jgi:hypothetical protein
MRVCAAHIGVMGALFGDLRSSRAMAAKAGLFVVCGVLVGVLLAARSPMLDSPLRTLGLFALGAWCFARAYYFAFYVIERYCDPAYRYSGILSAAAWVARRAVAQRRARR